MSKPHYIDKNTRVTFTEDIFTDEFSFCSNKYYNLERRFWKFFWKNCAYTNTNYNTLEEIIVVLLDKEERDSKCNTPVWEWNKSK